MKKSLRLILFFLLILIFNCSQANTGGSVTNNRADVNGKWKGKTASGIDFIAVISEKDAGLSGTISVPVIKLDKVQIEGSLNGENITFGDTTDQFAFTGKVRGNNASGTYDYPSTGDKGTWTAVKSAIYIFNDDFNRADSQTVGNGWHEGEGSGDTGKTADVRIADNKAVFTGGYESAYRCIPSISRSVTLAVPFEAEFVFGVDNGGFYDFDFSFVSADMYAINFNNDHSISYACIHNGTGTDVPLTNNYQLLPGHMYDLTVTVTDMIFTIYISDNGGRKMVYTFPAAGVLSSFFALNIGGGYHDGTVSYETLLDSVSFE
jgi:hypothetical protein